MDTIGTLLNKHKMLLIFRPEFLYILTAVVTVDSITTESLYQTNLLKRA